MSTAISPMRSPGRMKKKLGLFALVGLTFYSVSGGPFGIEEIVKAGGPLYALLGFSLLLVWAVPEALITTELATAIPEASGSVAWVTLAFGPFWGFQEGWLSYLSGVADNSLYPILLLDTFVSLIQSQGSDSMFSSGLPRLLFIILLTVLLTYLNYRGLDVVGRTTIIICTLTMMPFVVFCIIGAFKVDPTKWLATPENGIYGINWRLFLNTFFWNINYWDSAACFAGEVDQPGKTYPLGMSLAVLLVGISSFLPVLIGTGASDIPYHEWKDGHFTFLAVEICGNWLGVWMMFAASITNIGTFIAEMSTDAWQVAGMADRGIIPKVVGTRNVYGTPTYGILISASGVLVLCWLSFSEVIEMLNILYCFSQLIEFAAFVKLRISHPDMSRPYKIPLGTAGVTLLLLCPSIFAIIIIAISSKWAFITAVVTIILGIIVHAILRYMRVNGICEFENQYEDCYDNEGSFYLNKMHFHSVPTLELHGSSNSASDRSLKPRSHSESYGSNYTASPLDGTKASATIDDPGGVSGEKRPLIPRV
mmetsp:Transcript_6236/g.9401  ORF Transcript_6236/g.9401 Transcript_6236/m.9401 type:complete len:536 (+) Transcript_6236:60-1667(+)|eukprot:CAMPEP_0185023518 /NCGR_PEP_ID=MMETSP1103-20130426/6182_1 /TAXON_ID=36769 /ORGANISM="Paraphysomonas bandaiensis, Strain Caron Lab Isolate" /LENGTH=535 /DNA_ID=CAMNT_0027556145 /DNA_START=67 /DNA_END=1674 /DNA_ORIENTATION=+